MQIFAYYLRSALLQCAHHRDTHAFVRALQQGRQQWYHTRASHFMFVLFAFAQAPKSECAASSHLNVLVQLNLVVRVVRRCSHSLEQRYLSNSILCVKTTIVLVNNAKAFVYQSFDAVVLADHFSGSFKLGHVGDCFGGKTPQILVLLGQNADHCLQAAQVRD